MRTPLLIVAVGIASVSFGVGTSTMYWAAQLGKQFRAQGEWKSLVQKQRTTIDAQRTTIKAQSDTLNRLMAATDHLVGVK